MLPKAAIAEITTLLKNANDSDAEKRCGELLEKFPRDPELLHLAAIIAARAQNFWQAIHYANMSLEVRPDHAATVLLAAKVARALGNNDLALELFSRLIKLEPNHALAWFSLGLVRQDLSDSTAAIEAYQTAWRLKPDMVEAVVNLGICLQNSGDLDGAKAAYGAAIRIRSDTFGRISQALVVASKGELWLNLGMLHANLVSHASSRGSEFSSIDATL